MGAYENPPIIQQPDLGSIWAKNFRYAQMATRDAFAPAIKFKQEEEARERKRDITAAKLRKEAGNTRPALTSFAIQRVDNLDKAKRDLKNKVIDNDTYLKIESSEIGVVNKIAANGAALSKFTNELTDKNISNFQSSKAAKGLAFLSAFNEQRFTNFNYNENEGALNIGFTAPDGDSVIMKESEYTDPGTYDVNEVFSANDTIETGIDLLKSKLTKEQDVSKYDFRNGTGTGVIKTQLWDDPRLKDKESRVNFILNSSFMKELTVNETGSYTEDTLRKEINNFLEDPDYIEVTKELSPIAKKVVDESASTHFINKNIKLPSGENINPADYMQAMAKRKIARQIVEEGPNEITSKEIDTRTGSSDKKEARRISQLETAKPLIGEIEVPRDKEGRINLDDTSFTNELARLNLAVDKSGSFEAGEDKVIAVKSNITNKTLNVTGEMSDLDVKNALMLLSGATTEEADEAYPLRKGLGVQENLFTTEKPKLP